MNFDYRRAHGAAPNLSGVFPRRSLASATLSPKEVKKPVVHMIFEEASDCETDPYWSNQLLQAARGDFKDKKIIFDGVYLIKKDTNEKELVPQVPEEAAKAFVSFHRKHSKVSSGKDIEQQNAIRERAVNQVIIVEWSSASKKRRRALLFDYVFRCEREAKPTADQLTSLQLAVNIAFNNSMLSQHSVEMKNSVILSISCIARKEDGFWFLNRPLSPVRKTKAPAEPKKSSKIATIDDMWDDVVRKKVQ